jgi:hypothetical protein
MTTEQPPLSGFERRLLDQLRHLIVVERPGLPSTPDAREGTSRARLGWRGRVALAAGIAAVAALAVMAGLPRVDGGTSPKAAYGVTTNDDGTVSVEIREIRDAEGLQRRLREAGIPAVVRYLPPGRACEEQAFALVRPGSGRGVIETSEHGSMRFEIDKRSLQPGQTLVIYTIQDAVSGQPGDQTGEPATSLAISIVEGKVAGC